MDRTAFQHEIRNALSLADELSRDEHARGDDSLSGNLAAMRSALAQLEREVGGSGDLLGLEPETVSAVERSLEALLVRRDVVPTLLAGPFARLLTTAERISIVLWEPEARVPSKPVLGGLPLARLVPQAAHAIVDTVASAAFVASAFVARTSRARAVAACLGLAGGAATLVTDTRPSAAKLLPIEAHEVFDHAWGAAAVVAPFALGYVRRDPLASALQIVAGLGTIAVALLTDYRADKGLTWSRGRIAGAKRRRTTSLAEGTRRPRVPEVQRPLEGLSAAPTDWQPDHSASGQGDYGPSKL